MKPYYADAWDVLRNLLDGSVDTAITDPPYNEVNRWCGHPKWCPCHGQTEGGPA
jgi:DNA modification methylase